MSPSSNNPKGNPHLLVKAAEKKKQNAAERLEKAIQQVLDSGETITFKAIAETAGLSVSYLYKYPEIKNRIAELRNQQKAAIGGIVNKTSKFQPATDKSKAVIISKLRQENRKLRNENEDLKKHIEIAQGKVIELRVIEAENNRLKAKVEELEKSLLDAKVTPIDKKRKSKSNITDEIDSKLDKLSIELESIITDDDTEESVIDYIKSLGIKVSKKLKTEIANRNIAKVKLSIEAFKQYRETHNITSQEACLLSMICDEAEPNTESIAEQSTIPEQKIVTANDKPQKERATLTELIEISDIFDKDE